MFEDHANYDPARDGKVPLSRSPMALVLRGGMAFVSMLLSKHPLDAFRWLRAMLARRRPLSYVLPWLTFDAIRAVDSFAQPGMRIFEFGSGHSTLFWAERGMQIHAVEDHEGWHGLLADRLAGMRDVQLYFEPTRDGYVSCIDHAGGSFDVVVVDGSHRKECLVHALGFVKPGGLLVVDNTDWHWYDDVDTLVPESWRKQVLPGWAPFIGHRSETTIWRAAPGDSNGAPRRG